MTVKLCTQCNEKVDPDSLLCKYCGVPVQSNSAEAPPSSNDTSRNYLKITVYLVVLILIIGILFGILK